MAVFYNTTKDAILKYARKIGYDNKHFQDGKLTKEDKENICLLYNEYDSQTLADKYGVSRGVITKIWYDNNLKGKEVHKYHINYHYFNNIDTKDKAYFLGWLASDGNVYKRTNKPNTKSIIKLSLNYKDYEILELFKKYIKTEKPLIYTQRRIGKNKEIITYAAVLEIVSDEVANDLSKYNIIPNKTWEYEIVELDNKLMNHFLRGYFDGDGSIYFRCNDADKLSQYDITISGFVHNLEKIQNFLNKVNIKSIIILDKRKKHHGVYDFGSLTFSNIENMYRFITYLYKDCDDLYLKRKKLIADNFINIFNNNCLNNNKKCLKILENAVLNETNK